MPKSNHDQSGRPELAALRWYSCLVAGLCQVGLAIASVLLLLDTVLIGVNVILRYVFHAPFLGTEELVSASLILIVMLSAPEVLRRGNHIGVDILIGLLSPRWTRLRSEEHTSELQSRGHLVCRLLLEKKKDDLKHSSISMIIKSTVPVITIK